MTPELLLACMPFAGLKRATTFAPFLAETMERYRIVTPRQSAVFLAHVCHESGSLVYVREIADGSAYEGRRDLGNTEPGDGKRFPGRGLPQITGRLTYDLCGKGLGIDLIRQPELLEEPRYAALSAGWFWRWKGISDAAEQNNFFTTTKLWNGGYNGGDDRVKHWLRIRRILGVVE